MKTQSETRNPGAAPSTLIALGAALLVIGVVGVARIWHTTASAADPAAVLERYCIGCHNGAERAGDLALDRLSPELVEANVEDWEHVVRKVRTGFMPPAGEPRPTRAVLDRFAAVLEERLDAAAATRAVGGFKNLSRLNRTEYTNAVRDLLAYDARAIAATLPADDAIQGFDNIAAALTVSPTLIERYVSAALKISRAAIGDSAQTATQVTYTAPIGSQARHVDGLPLGTRGGFALRHDFPLDATYEIRVRTRGSGPLGGPPICPLPRVDLTLDGEALNVEDAAVFKRRVSAGPHTLTVALLDERRCEGVNELFGVYAPSGRIEAVEIHGPFEPEGLGDTPSRREIFVCRPSLAAEENACAREILTRLATRGYRRPLSNDDPAVETLMSFYESGRRNGSFDSGIERALGRLLVDPRFLYRLEEEPAGTTPGQRYAISDVELASRLSFFLWSSIPDEELLSVAATGRLNERDTLERQVRRMLADPRSDALVENFAGQWLKLRELENALPQDPLFDGRLRASFRTETELLFEHVMRDDLPIIELLAARYTFLDEQLARHYGIDGVVGSYFRRVALPEDSPRGGLLGQGSILTATSAANRTSPVVRGAWVVENVLGAEVPPPPPGVEADLSGARSPVEAKTLRQRMEAHRTNPVCAACHRLIDPFGFALEPFDLVGRWRERDAGEPIDSTTTLVDGTAVDGPIALRHALLDRSDAFVRSVTERLMTYALGRILDAHDQPAVRRIVAVAAADDVRFSAIVTGIVTSAQFRTQTKRATEEP